MTSALASERQIRIPADRGGLFSGINQDLKEVTETGVYQFTDSFQTRLKYRRDFGNAPFLPDEQSAASLRFAEHLNPGNALVVWRKGGELVTGQPFLKRFA